jgi:hypothetical protein
MEAEMTGRLELFKKALVSSKDALTRAPHMFPLEAAITQLEYLLDLANGRTSDRTGLDTVTIGQIAARDIETFDPALADLLHDVSAEVRKMTQQP